MFEKSGFPRIDAIFEEAKGSKFVPSGYLHFQSALNKAGEQLVASRAETDLTPEMLTSGAQAATGHKERWHEIVDWFRKRLFAGDLMAYYLDRNGKLVQVTKDTFALKDAEHMFSEHQQDVLPFLLVEAELDKALNLSALSSKKAANATVREAKMPPKRISQDELRAWFLDRVKKWPNMTPPPNKEDCYQQHRKHFKERALVSREFIALRQAGGKACIIPRCWRTRGQRPLDWHSKLDDEWVKKLKFKTEHKMPKI